MIPAAECMIDPGETKEVAMGPVTWGLGQQSYWWPKIPFREDYQTTLHYLGLELTVNGKVADRHRRRRLVRVRYLGRSPPPRRFWRRQELQRSHRPGAGSCGHVFAVDVPKIRGA
ncbi:MAG TPA: hypothetical protein ENH84_07005 [Phycisphaerae bacterium]|nr:hypothetical protein [Phycisphaerae bacterium]